MIFSFRFCFQFGGFNLPQTWMNRSKHYGVIYEAQFKRKEAKIKIAQGEIILNRQLHTFCTSTLDICKGSSRLAKVIPNKRHQNLIIRFRFFFFFLFTHNCTFQMMLNINDKANTKTFHILRLLRILTICPDWTGFILPRIFYSSQNVFYAF